MTAVHVRRRCAECLPEFDPVMIIADVSCAGGGHEPVHSAAEHSAGDGLADRHVQNHHQYLGRRLRCLCGGLLCQQVRGPWVPLFGGAFARHLRAHGREQKRKAKLAVHSHVRRCLDAVVSQQRP